MDFPGSPREIAAITARNYDGGFLSGFGLDGSSGWSGVLVSGIPNDVSTETMTAQRVWISARRGSPSPGAVIPVALPWSAYAQHRCLL